MKIILPFAIIPLIFTGIIFSDAGYYDMLNGPLMTSQGEHPTIIMESENVIIEPDYNGAKIDAEFVFYNDGPATEVTMFFPISEMMNAVGNLLDLYSPTDKEFIDAIKELGVDERILKDKEIMNISNGNDAGFMVKVNNLNIPVDYITEDKLDENYTLTENKFTRWTVKFTKGEKKTITCSFNQNYHMHKFGFGTPAISYILSSGSGWKGPIGEGTIIIHRSLSKFNAPLFFVSPTAKFYTHYIGDTMWGYFTELTSIGDIPPAEVSVSGDIEEITWSFSNYEPNSKISLMIYVGIMPENMSENAFEINELFSALGLERSKFFPGITLKDGQNFRKEPSTSADPVSGRPQLNKGEVFNIIGTRGEWWNIKLKDGTEGWIRWRFVDPDTGELYIHASLIGTWKPDE